MKRTKIVATIGPASANRRTLLALAKAGMDVARLNMSHGSHEWHRGMFKEIRAVEKEIGRPIAIIADLQGPRIRVGTLPEKGIKLVRGKMLTFTTIKPVGDQIFVTYAGMHRDLKKGDHILLDSGALEVEVIRIKGHTLQCRVIVGGTLYSNKGINVPKRTLHVSPITSKDKRDLEFAVENGADFIAMSFVMRARDIVRMRQMIYKIERRLHYKSKDLVNRFTTRTRIIAKIEKHEAITHFDEILDVVDVVMVARGDLGLETPIEELPLEQKNLIARCIDAAVPVITATQMMASMVNNPRPTRAEVSDVANAVIDHTDAVMLSEETAAGSYPVQAVEMMAKVINGTETSRYDDVVLRQNQYGEIDTVDGLTAAARDLAYGITARAVVVATVSGYTAKLVARFRSEIPLVAVVPTIQVQRQMQLVWGVQTLLVAARSAAELVEKALPAVRHSRLCKKHDRLVFVAAHTTDQDEPFNILKIERC